MYIIDIPIEDLDMRYTTQWRKWFVKEYDNHNIPYRQVRCSGYETIRYGSFLDAMDTNVVKADQIRRIWDMLKWPLVQKHDKIVLMFHDIWHFGVMAAAYIRDGVPFFKDKIKIFGCLHAGTYDPTDYISQCGMAIWGKPFENSILRAADCVFVGTEYHRRMIWNKRKHKNNICTSGFPIYVDEITRPAVPKEKIIVFPHRLVPEKRPDIFDRLAMTSGLKEKGWEFIKTHELRLSKEEYYNLLSRASVAVSTAEHENWGISMQEAVFNGCIPIVPDGLSYREMYPVNFRYSTFDDLLNAMREATLGYYSMEDVKDIGTALSQKGKVAIPNMIDTIDYFCKGGVVL